MRDVLHLEVEQFLSAAADDLAIAIVDADEAARQVDLAEAGGRLVDQGRQMRLAFPQRLLGALSLGDLALRRLVEAGIVDADGGLGGDAGQRSEEHTSELQSLMRISYAVFCLKKQHTTNPPH